jgi:hypothetical protein
MDEQFKKEIKDALYEEANRILKFVAIKLKEYIQSEVTKLSKNDAINKSEEKILIKLKESFNIKPNEKGNLPLKLQNVNLDSKIKSSIYETANILNSDGITTFILFNDDIQELIEKLNNKHDFLKEDKIKNKIEQILEEYGNL